jgi:hypothetical protein
VAESLLRYFPDQIERHVRDRHATHAAHRAHEEPR